MITETFRELKSNFIKLLAIGAPLYILAQLLPYLLGVNALFNPGLNFLLQLVSMLLTSWVSVGWYRSLVLQENVGIVVPRVPVASVLKYIGVTIAVIFAFIVATVVAFLPLILIAGVSVDDFAGSGGVESLGALLYMIVVVVVIAFIAMRMVPMFVSAATGKIIWFAESWRITRGNLMNIFLLFLLFFGFVLGFMVVMMIFGGGIMAGLASGGTGGAIAGFGIVAILGIAFSLFVVLFMVVWASVFFRRVSGITGAKIDEVFE